jgi:hypothetical protein
VRNSTNVSTSARIFPENISEHAACGCMKEKSWERTAQQTTPTSNTPKQHQSTQGHTRGRWNSVFNERASHPSPPLTRCFVWWFGQRQLDGEWWRVFSHKSFTNPTDQHWLSLAFVKMPRPVLPHHHRVRVCYRLSSCGTGGHRQQHDKAATAMFSARRSNPKR